MYYEKMTIDGATGMLIELFNFDMLMNPSIVNF